MNIYHGTSRRQVGRGRIFDSILRGLRPILDIIKPLAKQAGKRLGHSALAVGTKLAGDAMTGNLNRQSVKTTLKDEAEVLTQEGIRNLKRKLTGEGYKHSQPPSKKRKVTRRKMPARRAKKRSAPKKRGRCATRPKRRKAGKPKATRKSVKKGRAGKRKSVKRRSVSRKALKDIFN